MLLQQGKGGDMASAFGGGGSQTAFGARAGATVLTKATAVLGVLFMIGAIALGDHRQARRDVADGRPQGAGHGTPAPAPLPAPDGSARRPRRQQQAPAPAQPAARRRRRQT